MDVVLFDPPKLVCAPSRLLVPPHASSYCLSFKGMGATWAPQLIHLVGNALGEEARGLHNSFVSTGDRTPDCNGCGITLYSPNLNLVRDPRW